MPAVMRVLNKAGARASVFCTLGQYDFIIAFEAPDEKEAMKWAIPWGEFCETQTTVAVPYEEALKLLK